MTKPTDILLEGVAGSHAFGLATSESDIDTHGIYRAPLDEVLGLNGPKVVTESWTQTNPDIALHEVGKFIGLALKCNPTVLETLWMTNFTKQTFEGNLLIAHRQKFLFTKGVRNAYGGYATAQLKKLKEGRESRLDAKLGRHAMRLMLQGTQLLSTGDMRLDCTPDRDYLFEMGELAVTDTPRFVTIFENNLWVLENCDSVLPEINDHKFFHNLLVIIRLRGEGL